MVTAFTVTKHLCAYLSGRLNYLHIYRIERMKGWFEFECKICVSSFKPFKVFDGWVSLGCNVS
jgi:hypothetical protein